MQYCYFLHSCWLCACCGYNNELVCPQKYSNCESESRWMNCLLSILSLMQVFSETEVITVFGWKTCNVVIFQPIHSLHLFLASFWTHLIGHVWQPQLQSILLRIDLDIILDKKTRHEITPFILFSITPFSQVFKRIDRAAIIKTI